MPISSVTVRFDGIITLEDGRSEPFRGHFDGQVQGSFSDQQQFAREALADADVVASLNTAMGSVNFVNAPTTSPNIGIVTDIVVNFTGVVAYDDNRIDTFAVVFDDNDVARLVGSEQALIDLANDETGSLDKVNTALANASGVALSITT